MMSIRKIFILLVLLAVIGCKEKPRGEDAYNGDNRCYTPCRQGLLQSDGIYVSCSEEGLMKGCLDDRVCSLGSCHLPDAGVSGCEADVECPDFQRCIDGYCQVECETNEECDGDSVCYRHVCRLPCSSNKEEEASGVCAETEYCRTEDGEWGYCMPLEGSNVATQESALTTVGAGGGGNSDDDEESEETQKEDEEQGDDETSTDPDENSEDALVESASSNNPDLFGVSPLPLAFSNTHIADAFKIYNLQPTAEQFTVRKLKHVEYADAGTKVVKDNPLSWIEMGTDDETEKTRELTVLVDGADKKGTPGEKSIRLEEVVNEDLLQWTGEIEVVHQTMGVKKIGLSYSSTPNGQWSGKMYSFAQFGDAGLDVWAADKMNEEKLENVENAFIKRWAAFKAGQLSFDEFKAVLQATEKETWKLDAIQETCEAGEQGEDVACYLYDNSQGYAVYTYDQTQFPIPSAVSYLDIAMNLKISGSDNRLLSGKIVSSKAPQFAGDPAVALTFLIDPMEGCDDDRCLVPLESFDATIRVGGRHAAVDGKCANAAFEQFEVPWLVPGFTENTEADGDNEGRYYRECRETTLPFAAGDERADYNPFLAGSNPIPDGKVRSREITLVDGAMINQKQLFIIYKEHFDSFLGAGDSDGFSAYGYMILSRTPAQLEEGDYEGSPQKTSGRNVPDDLLRVGCDEEMLEAALGPGKALSAGNAWTVASVMLNGMANEPTAELAAGEAVHYYCEDTGLFDGGSSDKGSSPQKAACPAGSRVIFFTLIDGPESLADESCNDAYKLDSDNRITARGTCQITLNEWVGNDYADIRLDPVWRCTDPNEVYCDANRRNLRDGKIFFGELPEGDAPFQPLRVTIANAFRYKTRFRNRQGTSVGFVPEICVNGSDSEPYCYEPAAIEEIAKRVNCAAAVYMDHRADFPTDENRSQLLQFLKETFSKEEIMDMEDGSVDPREGFEFLSAELLIMLGDDAYTNSFAARLDLDEIHNRGFEGDRFEVDGINLSGGAGYEMVSLYQAVQYYQMVLDRFYDVSPMIGESLAIGVPNGFVTGASVTTYFARVVRASSQKSRALSEIAKRYQNFNRPDLAYNVVERAYASTYQESIVMSQMMVKVTEALAPEDRVQVVYQLENAQLAYRSALLDMIDVHRSVQQDVNFFGFAPDYIPFPALDDNDINSFEKVLAVAKQRMTTAAQKEEKALESDRSFDVDRESFQSELKKLKDSYENRLAEICGTFEGDDGNIYPAISLYTHMSAATEILKQPCGLVGNGQIHEAMAQMETRAVDLKSAMLAQENTLKRMDIAQDRIVGQCNVKTQINSAAKAAIQTIRSEQNYHLDAILNRRAAVIDEFVGLENSQVASIMEKKQIKMKDTAQVLNDLVKSKRGEIKTIQYDLAKNVLNCNDEIRKTEVEISDAQKKYEFATSNLMTTMSQAITGAVHSMVQVVDYIPFLERDNSEYADRVRETDLGDVLDYSVQDDYLSVEPEKHIHAQEQKIEMLRMEADKRTSELEIELEVESRTKQTELDCALVGLDAELDQELRRLDGEKMKELEALDTALQKTLRNLDTKLDLALRDLDVRLECELAEVDFKAQVKEMMLNMAENSLNILRADYNLSLSFSEIQKLYNQAKRALSEMAEHEQLVINIEAAKNNPNVRIYRNDAMINADRTFWNALKEAYKATKVYEYYTSQTYGKLQDLFLIRSVSIGDINLESYLDELEYDFETFEESFGNPDTRVAVLSLRDDLLDISYLKDNGDAMSELDRVQALRTALNDAHLIDTQGRIAIPFSTVFNALSPMTRNHKIKSVEAEIIGSNVGDTMGRLYLRQDGTGTLHAISGDKVYYELPERLAVLNPLFNGTRVFDGPVYKNKRLMDRPFINSHWELIIDQRNEEVNKDIDLNSLTDIRLYIYYTDFTEL